MSRNNNVTPTEMVAHYGEMNLGRKDEEGVRAFYREIPPKGERTNTIGPVELRKQLKVDEKEFKQRQEKLKEHGLIKTVQGGGIYRVDRGDEKKNEVDYYEPIRRELELHWAEEPGREYHLRQRFLRVLDTHHRGRGRDGQWARPDLTLIGGKVLPHLPGKFLDVITFEVKLGMPLDGLYEALAHRRRANFAYVVCVCPEHEGPPDPTEQAQATLVAEATRQGIGVILVRQEDDFGLWSELVEPVRHEPDPQHLHDFLETHCDRKGCLEDLGKWLDRKPSELPPVSEMDVRRLELTTEEQELALEMVEMTRDDSSKSYPLSKFTGLWSEQMVGRVRDVLKEGGLIRTVQRSGAIKARSEL